MGAGNKQSLRILSDAELCAIIRRRTRPDAEAAFVEIHNRYAPRIYAYCRRILNDGSIADDISQEVFLRFHGAVVQGRPISNVSGLLFVTARNLCLNQRQREERWNSVSLDDVTLSGKDTEYGDKELAMIVRRALDLLSDEYREAFVLREYVGLSYGEIAITLGASVATAKIRVVRAKKKLRKILAEHLRDLITF